MLPNPPSLFKLSKQYLAGFFDGEGWISVQERPGCLKKGRVRHTPYFSCTIGFANCNKNVMDAISQQFGGKVMARKPQQRQRQIAYIVHIQAEKKKDFLKAIMPYLIVKKQVAQLALELLKEFRPRGKRNRHYPLTDDEIAHRHEMAVKIANLNNRSG